MGTVIAGEFFHDRKAVTQRDTKRMLLGIRSSHRDRLEDAVNFGSGALK